MLAIYAVPIGGTCAALAFWINRQVFGFLPDDLPRPGRKLHRRPVPLAGIALLPPILGWAIAADRWWFAGAAIAATAIGFVDDWYKELGRELGWRKKLLVLGLAAAAVAFEQVDPTATPWRWFGTWLLVVVLTNATNFLDNTDGVAAAVSSTSLVIASHGHGPMGAAGFAALAFLPWNWPRPLLFLGDSGAYLLGLCAGALAASDLDAIGAFAVQLGDFAQVVCARLYLGLPPWVGDRRHLTHIAQNLGLPAILVAPLFAAITAIVAVAWSSR